MTVVWTILKIIGLILLTLLGLLAAAVLLVLFVPIRYRVDGTYQEELEAKARITWLFHLLSVKAAYDGTFRYCVRIFGIRLLPKKEKQTGKKPDGSVKKTDAKEAAPKHVNAGETATDRSGGPQEETDRETVADSEKTDPAGKNSAGLRDRILGRIRKFREKYRTILQKIRKIRDNISYYINILEREETKQVLSHSFVQLKGIVRHVLPRELDICFLIGTDDPASTGQLLALQGMLYPVLQNRVRMIPDFEEKRVEGTFHAKGRIRIVVLLICALRVLLNKNLRQLIKLLKKKEEG